MTDFEFQRNRLHEKMFHMLNHSEESRDCFTKYYFDELTQLIEDMIKCYESRIKQAERKILELEKELIFSGQQEDSQ